MKAMKNTAQEKRMLLVAQNMRRLVKADVEKTAHPAIIALVRALGPMIARLGPKVLSIAKSLPPDMWADIAGNVAKMIGQAAQGAAANAAGAGTGMAGGNARAASAEERRRDIDQVVASTAKRLAAHGVKAPSQVAKALVISSVRAVVAHKKSPSKKMADAIHMIEEAQAEISIIREFF